MPKADVKGPDLDVSGKGGFNLPSINIDIKKPEFPSFDIDFKGPKFGGKADGDISVEGDVNLPDGDLNVSTPDIDGNISIEGREVDIDGSDADISLKGKGKGKFKMPKFGFKTPTFNVKGNVDKPDVDLKGDIDMQGVVIAGPDVVVEGPNVDVDVSNKGGIHLPSFEMKKPEFPSFDIKGPKFGAKGDTNMQAEIEGPNIDIQGSDIDA